MLKASDFNARFGNKQVKLEEILHYTLPLKDLDRKTGEGNISKGYIGICSHTNVIVDAADFFEVERLQQLADRSQLLVNVLDDYLT